LSLAGVVLLAHVALEGFVCADFEFLTLNRDLSGVLQPFIGFGKLVVGCCFGGFLGRLCLFRCFCLDRLVRRFLGLVVSRLYIVFRLKPTENVFFTHATFGLSPKFRVAHGCSLDCESMNLAAACRAVFARNLDGFCCRGAHAQGSQGEIATAAPGILALYLEWLIVLVQPELPS
jgi:hypothetical protein